MSLQENIQRQKKTEQLKFMKGNNISLCEGDTGIFVIV